MASYKTKDRLKVNSTTGRISLHTLISPEIYLTLLYQSCSCHCYRSDILEQAIKRAYPEAFSKINALMDGAENREQRFLEIQDTIRVANKTARGSK